MTKIALGIDIGGTNTKLGLVTRDGNMLGFKTFPTDSKLGFSHFKNALLENIKALLSEHNIKMEDLKGVGVGSPNANGNNGKIEKPTNLKWGDVDFIGEMKPLIPVPLYLQNDANVAAIGEGLWGAAKDINNFIVVTLGTGVGTGVVLNGKLIIGSSGLAGEGGHIVIEPEGRLCGCGGLGHLECYASVRGIKTTTHELLGEDLHFRDIAERYRGGDQKMIQVFDYTAKKLAIGLAAMGSLVLPDVFVLAGGVATIGEDFRAKVEKYYNEFVFGPFKDLTPVKISTISTAEGAVLGAASLVFY